MRCHGFRLLITIGPKWSNELGNSEVSSNKAGRYLYRDGPEENSKSSNIERGPDPERFDETCAECPRPSSTGFVPHSFAAACSAFDSVSFWGWTMDLLTAARAAPRFGNSVSTPSRCRT